MAINDFNLGLIGKLDGTKSKQQLNNDIEALKKQLNSIEITAKLDPKVLGSIQIQLQNLQLQLNNVTVSQGALNGLVSQINSVLQHEIQISGVNLGNIGNQAHQMGQQIGQQINQGVSQSLSGNTGVLDAFRRSLRNIGMGSEEIDAVANRIENLGVKIEALNQSTSHTVGRRGNRDILSVDISGTDKLGQAIKLTEQYNMATGDLIRSMDSVSTAQQKAGSSTNTFAKQQSQAVTNLTNQINQLNRAANDQNKARPITDSTHLDRLSTSYNEIISAIQRMGNSSSDTFVAEQNNVKTLISNYKSLVSEFRNAENVSTKMKGTDFVSGLAIARNDLEKFKADAKDFPQIIQTINNLDTAISSVGDASSLNKFNDDLRVARSELAKIKSETSATNRNEKVGINVSGLQSQIADLQRISPEIDKFEANINGAKVTVQSLLTDLANVNTQSDFSVINSKWKAFTDSAKSAGIAISEVATKSDSLTEKVNKIQLSFDNGHGDSEYKNRIQSLVNDFEKYGLSVDEANKKTSNLRTILDGFKVDGNFLPDDQLVAQADKFETEFKAVKVSLDSAKLSFDKFLQPVSSEKASVLIIKINDFLTKNTAITKEAKEELQGYVRLLQSGNVNLSDWNKFDTRLKEINQDMRVSGRLGKNLKQTLIEGAKSFAQWTFSSGMVMEVVQTVKTLTNNVIELDNKLLELVKVSDLTADGLEKATERAYKLGDTVGKTGTQVIGAVTEFKRAGYNMEESFDMAEAALVMTNVAEGITETSDAAGTLISVLKGFNMADSEAMSIVDMINATSNASPIGFDQLAEGLERTAGTLAQSGNTIQQTIGLLTAGYAQLRNVEKVSQGLITISARIRGVGEDGETIDGLSSKMSEDFGKIGVAVENADGSLRSIYQIAQDYSKVLPTLTDKQKQYYAELAAGKHQVTVWNSIVKQFKDAENATTQAINSVGSASEENQKYLDSISGKISIFNSSVEDLSNTLLNSNIIKFFIDLGTVGVKATDGLISSLDFLGGSLGTLATIGSGVLGAMGHGLTNYVTNIIVYKSPFRKQYNNAILLT